MTEATATATLAVVVAVAVIAFFDWVPTPLNRNIEGAGVRERLIGTLIHVTAGLIAVVANGLRWKWVMLAGAIWFTFVLGTALVNWWLPWLTGITIGEIKPETNLGEYARNTRILPGLGRSPIVPDVQHTLIHLAVLAACILQWRAFLSV